MVRKEEKEPHPTEGRHIAGPEAADKIDAAQSTYWKSDKGKKTRSRYLSTDRGRAAAQRRLESPGHKLSQQKYHYSNKGQGRRRTDLDNKIEMRKVRNWLQQNPGKTPEDYLKENPNEN